MVGLLKTKFTQAIIANVLKLKIILKAVELQFKSTLKETVKRAYVLHVSTCQNLCHKRSTGSRELHYDKRSAAHFVIIFCTVYDVTSRP